MTEVVSSFRYNPEPFGEVWDPTDPSSPHQYDYKFSLAENPEAIAHLESIFRKERAVSGSQALDMDWLCRNGSFRKFTHNVSNKKGVFIQASCIVTDGLETGRPRYLLTTVRSSEQVFESGGDRHKPGDSCLFSTVLASFECQDPYGHVPTALFNNVKQYCPWALFSRKLLLPDLYMDSRFLGVAYNFENTDKKYVFLIWHVRTSTTPPTMQISERQEKKHDVPHWMSLERAHEMNFSKKPADRYALNGLLTRLDGNQRPIESDEKTGFLPELLFQSTWKDPIPKPVMRDEIILDLCRIYQQSFHAFGERIATSHKKISERELEHHFKSFLERQSRNDRFQVVCIQQPVTGEPGSGTGGARLDLDVRIRDNRNPTGTPASFRYVVELKVIDQPEGDPRHLGQCFEEATRLLNNHDQPVDAIVLMLGIRKTHNVYPIQGTITYPNEAIPIHVIKVALQPMSPSKYLEVPMQVSHAIIPIAFGDNSVEDIILVRRPEEDATARLPGGTVEASEFPEKALRRELGEELGMKSRDITELYCLLPGNSELQPGLPLTDNSSGQGVERAYRFHPFVVKLSTTGRKKLEDQLGKPSFYPRLANIQQWAADGFGQTTVYPRAIVPLLSQELLNRYGLRLPENHPARPQ